MTAGNPVYGISNYVDVVPQQNQVYIDPSQMFTIQQAAQLQAHHPTQHSTTTTLQQVQAAQLAAQQQHQTSQQQQLQAAGAQQGELQNIGAQHGMIQQAMVPQGIALQQMMPPGMIISNGMGGFIQYPQTTGNILSPANFVQFPQGIAQMGQMGQMQMILQPTVNIRHAKPVGRTPIPRNTGISGTQGTGISDQSGAGKVKKKKPSPSARRRSRLR
jgi:hypothetical protein